MFLTRTSASNSPKSEDEVKFPGKPRIGLGRLAGVWVKVFCLQLALLITAATAHAQTTVTSLELAQGGAYDGTNTATFANAGGGGTTITFTKDSGVDSYGGASAPLFNLGGVGTVSGLWLGSDDLFPSKNNFAVPGSGTGLDSETYTIDFSTASPTITMFFSAWNFNEDGDERIRIDTVRDGSGTDITAATTLSFAPNAGNIGLTAATRTIQGTILGAAGNDGGTLTIENTTDPIGSITFSRIEVDAVASFKTQPARNRSNGISLGPITYAAVPRPPLLPATCGGALTEGFIVDPGLPRFTSDAGVTFLDNGSAVDFYTYANVARLPSGEVELYYPGTADNTETLTAIGDGMFVPELSQTSRGGAHRSEVWRSATRLEGTSGASETLTVNSGIAQEYIAYFVTNSAGSVIANGDFAFTASGLPAAIGHTFPLSFTYPADGFAYLNLVMFDPTVQHRPSIIEDYECPTIEAVDDPLGNVATGTSNAGNVLGNDDLFATTPTVTTVDLTVTTPATSIGGGPVPVLDPLTGDVSVPPGTTPGNYTISYQICEAGATTLCDTADVTLTVTAVPFDIDTSAGNACVAGGGTLSAVNLFTTFDNGTFGFGDGSAASSPASDPYAADNPGGVYRQYEPNPTGFGDPGYGQFTYVANIVVPRNRFQHGGGILDPVDGITGRYFHADPGTTAPPVFRSNSTGLTPGAEYELSFWAADAEISLTAPKNAIEVTSNGAVVYNTGPISNTSTSQLTWFKYSTLVTVDAFGELDISFTPTELQAGGRDINLDNMRVVECLQPINASDDEELTAQAPGTDDVLMVLDNDTLNGNPATTTSVDISVVTPATPPFVGALVPVLDPVDGTVDIPVGTRPGTYSIEYQICEAGATTLCDTAIATVVVDASTGTGGPTDPGPTPPSMCAGPADYQTVTYAAGGAGSSTDITITNSFAFLNWSASNVDNAIFGGSEFTTQNSPLISTDVFANNFELSRPLDQNVTQVFASSSATGDAKVYDIYVHINSIDQMALTFNAADNPGVGIALVSGNDDTGFITTVPATLGDIIEGDQDRNRSDERLDGDDGLSADFTVRFYSLVPGVPLDQIVVNLGTDPVRGNLDDRFQIAVELCVGIADIELTKSVTSLVDTNGNGTLGDAGDTVNYAFSVTNTGDVDLIDVTITDPSATISGTIASLAVGATDATLTGSHVITGAEVTDMRVINTATVTGTEVDDNGDPVLDPVSGDPRTVSDDSDTGTEPDFDVTGSPVPIPNPETVDSPDPDGSTDGDPRNDPTILNLFGIVAQDDDLPDPVESAAGGTGVLNVLSANGSGEDRVNGLVVTPADVTISLAGAIPPGIVLNADGSVDVLPGTAVGDYSFDYEICETANPTNCDTATVTLSVADAGIGVVKSSVFNDESGDGNAQVGETITYTYTVTNEGDFDLDPVTLTETGFTGTGTTPSPTLQSGDNGDGILQTTETWIYTASYALTAADIAAGMVDNQAEVTGDTPGGSTVTDDSDSSNTSDGDGVGTPGDGPNNDDPTSTPLTASTIVAEDDTLTDPVDATNTVLGALDIFANNGSGTDTLNGAATSSAAVTVGPLASGTPVPAGLTLNPNGTVDVAAGTPAGPYTFDYEICEIGNPTNCDPATVTLTVGTGSIGVVKGSVFNDDVVADTNAQVGETITYTYTVTNTGDFPLNNVTLTETGFTGNGAIPVATLTSGDDGDGILQLTETWIYTATYALIATDITDGTVDNQATARGETPGGTPVSDDSDSSNPSDGDGVGTPGDGPNNDDPTTTPLTSAPIVAMDDTVVDPIDATTARPGILNVFDDNGAGPDTLNGTPTDSTDAMVEIVLSMPPPPGITLNPDGSVDVAAGTTPGAYMFDYEICEIGNPANCDTATVTLSIGEGQIAVVKDAVFNDDVIADSNAQLNETISYTYTVTNPGDFALSNVTLSETATFSGAGTVPTFGAPDSGDTNGDSILQTTETWIYTATYTLVAGDLPPAVTQVENQGLVSGDTPGDGVNPGTTVSDLSDSTNGGDGDGVGTPDGGPGNDDPTVTTYTAATIDANDDILPDPVDATTALPAVLNVLTATDVGSQDELRGVAAAPADVVITAIGAVPAELTFNTATGDVGVVAGTAPGIYTFTYQICEAANLANCDPAIVQLTVGEPAIGIVKGSVFNDESFDGFAQVGETITYTYTVTNEGDLPLGTVSITEAAPDFTGAGTAPVPALTAGDDGDSILEDGEIWTYSATYTLVAADIDAGMVDNLATVSGDSPNGTPVSDQSDSSNPSDGDGTGTPGDGPNNDDPTVTPLGSAPIVAEDDSVTGIDGLTGQTNVMDVLVDNGDGSDTLGGTPTNVSQVTISVVTPAPPIGGDPDVPVLNPATGQIDVPPGTPAGSYDITYEICETLNPMNCDPAVATVVVAAPVIDAVDDDFTPIPFDGQGGDTTPTVFTNDTLDGNPFVPADVTVTVVSDGGLTGVTVNPDGTLEIPPGTPAGNYPVQYQICDVVNPTICDTATATIAVGTIQAVPETFDTVNGDAGGITPSILTSDLLDGAVITNPADVVVTVGATTGGLTLDPVTNGIIVPPGTPNGPYTLEYTICDATNPTICSTITETVTVGTIDAIAEVFPVIADDGGTTTITVLDSDTLNGTPVSLTTVSLTLTSSDPELTLNPDGTITAAPGTPAGPYSLVYEICDLANPTICSSVTETVEMGVIGGIEAIKMQVLVDNGDGIDGVGDRLEYTITVRNTGNAPLNTVVLTDQFEDGSGAPLTLDTGPDFASASAGSPEGSLAIGETATYTASYVLQAPEVGTGLVSNVVISDAIPTAPPGYSGPPVPSVSDNSDQGNPADGDDNPTVYSFLPTPFLEGLAIVKTAAVSTVARGGVVPYTIEITNSNPGIAASAVTVDSLPTGFVYVDGSATIGGVPATAVVVNGRVISFPAVTVGPSVTVTIQLSARVLTGATPGDKVNKADVLDSVTGTRIAPTASATVRIEPEHVFDCGDVIGKVYDDLNHNGYQDEGEPGLPAVRIAGVDGTIITTDQYGRYHVPCAVLPEKRGTNFILKVDVRSLPSGYRITTENPRVIRLTRGKLSELNFGASISRIVRVDINSRAFMLDDEAQLQMVPELVSGIEGLLLRLKDEPSSLRIAFHLADEPTDAQIRTARKMTRAMRTHIKRRWRRVGDYKLNIETTFVRRK